MTLLQTVVDRGTCSRRKIGCILYSEEGIVLASGHNGPLNGKCNCPGKDVPAGAGNAICYGVHAEVRAVMSLAPWDRDRVHTCVTNKAPCKSCVLMLLGTNCQVIQFSTPSNETENRKLWEKANRQWEHKE